MTADKAATEFGRLVRSIRKERNLKSSQLAERVSIEVKHLGRIERGEKRPSFELVIALADALQVSPARFFAFDAAVRDGSVLKKKIARQLTGRADEELQRVYELLLLFLTPR